MDNSNNAAQARVVYVNCDITDSDGTTQKEFSSMLSESLQTGVKRNESEGKNLDYQSFRLQQKQLALSNEINSNEGSRKSRSNS